MSRLWCEPLHVLSSVTGVAELDTDMHADVIVPIMHVEAVDMCLAADCQTA